MKAAEKTQISFEYPKNFNFEKAFNKSFGLMKDDQFKVTVRLTGWARDFMRERIWSQDQKIKDNSDGSINITFSASSEPEVISLVLSLGENAKIVRPKWLNEDVKDKVNGIAQLY